MTNNIKEKVMEQYNKEVDDYTVETEIERRIIDLTVQECSKEMDKLIEEARELKE